MTAPRRRLERQRRRRSPRSANVLLLALLGVAALTFTACSGDGNDASDGDSATTLDSSTTTLPPSTTQPSTTTTSTTTAPWPRTPVAPLPAAGSVPVLSRIDTTDPVVFLTIDDGGVRDPRVVELLAQRKVPVTLFLTEANFRADPAYFARAIGAGGSINSHTRSHTLLTRLGESQQRNEICGMRAVLGEYMPVAGHLFRSPYGVQNATTQRVAASCGINAILHWHAAINDGRVQFQQGNRLQPGDIVLAHFRPDLYEGIQAFLFDATMAGLTVAPIEDYLPLP